MKSLTHIGFVLFVGFFVLSFPPNVLGQTSISPIVSLVAYPNVIVDGKSLTVEWSAQNASTCSASFAQKGENLPTRGLRILTPSAGRTIYTLTCINAQGSESFSTSKTVIIREQGDQGLLLPAIRFEANKTNALKGESITLSWEAQDAFACAGTGELSDWLGLKHTSGSATFSLQTSTTFAVQCWNANGELGPPSKLLIAVTTDAPLFIPEHEFSDSKSSQPHAPKESALPDSRVLCDRSATDFKKTKTVQCGRILWKFSAPTIARLGKDPLPYFYRYHEYYEFLQEYLNVEPSLQPFHITEDIGISSIKINGQRTEIRIPSRMARTALSKAAAHRLRPLVYPVAQALAQSFLASTSQQAVFLWHPSLKESFSDIIGISAYLAQSDRSTEVFWYDRWCEKKGKTKLCDSVLKSPDQFASISQDSVLARQRAIRVSFERMFPLKKENAFSKSGAELFSAVTVLIQRDLESIGKGNQYYQGLQETLQFMMQWDGFPEVLRTPSVSVDAMKRKFNVFVFLLSVNLKSDVSWYYERFGFPISRETKNLIGKFLSSANSESLAQSIDIIAGVASEAQQISAPGNGVGLRGLYYGTQKLEALKFSRIDPEVNYNWGYASPSPALASDAFSIRWTGLVEPRFSDSYLFHTLSDDGVRLWVDNKKIIDNWTDHVLAEDAGIANLEAGKKYPIQLEYYERTGHAVIKLQWSSNRQLREIIPTSQLYPL